MRDIELPGAFYVGRVRNAAGTTTDEPLLIDARDLTTHAVCIGMTGSGKTGLCLGLMEEAAIDGVPVIAIDPKGDIANLALSFPGLTPAEFRPWIDEDEARRQGRTPEQHAEAVAKRWSDGLAAWGEDGARVRRFRDSAEVSIYTPGDSSGIPLSPLASLEPPSESERTDDALLSERAGTTAASILALLGDESDALAPTHILLVAILASAWRGGRALDLAGLITAIQKPPITRLGVMELESVFPAKERFAFAMRLNALLASPAYAGWLSGEPLDVARLLYGPGGKPRISIISIAHLDDRQRMAVVALLFDRIVGWMRAQPGTSSLRALVYMDEIAGYAPPVANPPSKPPLMTLLKQARAFGVGLVLATQNPADLDYKALGNVGTWFVGRLQTDRDRDKVLDGIQSGASGRGLDRAAAASALTALASRVFLLHDVHGPAPLVFETRWTLSYLAGPMTRPQIARLRAQPSAGGAPAPAPVAPATAAAGHTGRSRPQLPPEIPQCVLPGGTAGTVYRPSVLGSARIVYSAAGGSDVVQDVHLIAELGALGPDWSQAREIAVASIDSLLASAPAAGASWAELP
nr:ATP-binding protein [Planctomycetota bacterium]